MQKVNERFLHKFLDGGLMPVDQMTRVNAKFKLKYQIANPIQLAVDTIKPLIMYRSKKGKVSDPSVIAMTRQYSMAGRWIKDSIHAKRKNGYIRTFEEGFFEEIDSILKGTSQLYLKRYNTHKGA